MREGYGAVSFETAYVRLIDPVAGDFDELGHVNNIVYLRWAQEMATTHWRKMAPAGLQSSALFVVIRHEADYRDPLLPGERAIARTWLGAARGPYFDRFVDIRKPDAAKFAARIKTTWCMIDAEKKRPRKVGADVLDVFGVPG